MRIAVRFQSSRCFRLKISLFSAEKQGRRLGAHPCGETQNIRGDQAGTDGRRPAGQPLGRPQSAAELEKSCTRHLPCGRSTVARLPRFRATRPYAFDLLELDCVDCLCASATTVPVHEVHPTLMEPATALGNCPLNE